MGLRRTDAPAPLREVVEREFPRDLPGLLSQLRSADAERRRWAARDLAVHPQAVPALGEALSHEDDAGVRYALFTSLTALADAASVDVLLPLLRTEDAGLRNGAIEALAEMPQAVSPRVEALLHDADPDVRIFAVNLLAELRHPRVPDWLAQVLAEDPQVNVVAAAIDALAEAGSPQHVPALRAASARFAADPFVGFAAQMAIERIEAA
ncbi:HEAT repeat domain-containing protein [Rubrivivax sp. JA1024]|nr:HEAT repeat domain-containing protein [Rubrivivax sp. JA1024]